MTARSSHCAVASTRGTGCFAPATPMSPSTPRSVRPPSGRGAANGVLEVGKDDLRRRVREHRVPYELCFVVDNSYSLHADRLVEKVKGLVFALLEDAVGRRDRVSLVAFKSGVPEAAIALRPTASLSLAGAAAEGDPAQRPHAAPACPVRRPAPAAPGAGEAPERATVARRRQRRAAERAVTERWRRACRRAGGGACAPPCGRRVLSCSTRHPRVRLAGRAAARLWPRRPAGAHLPLADVAENVFLDALVRMP